MGLSVRTGVCLYVRVYVLWISGWLGRDLVEMNWRVRCADGCSFGCWGFFWVCMYCNGVRAQVCVPLCNVALCVVTQSNRESECLLQLFKT